MTYESSLPPRFHLLENLTPPDAGCFESPTEGSANDVALMRGGSLLEKPDIAFQCPGDNKQGFLEARTAQMGK